MSTAGEAALIVLGSANVDVIVPVQRRPEPGETVLGGDPVTGPGGKGANTAVAAARLGTGVAFIGALGRDPGGDLLESALTSAGVDTSLVRRHRRPTGGAYITVTPDGENAIVVSAGANALVSELDVRQAGDRIAAARVLFAVLEVPMPTVRGAVLTAADAGVRVVLNASPVQELDAKTLGVLDPLVVNQHEARWLLGERAGLHPGELAAALLDRGPRSVVVTLGSDGVLVADGTGVVHLPAPRVRAVDTTGAGDAFAGALCGGLAAGKPLVDAARYAVGVAALSVTRHGAQASYPTSDEVPEL